MPAQRIEASTMDDLFRSRLASIINLRHELVLVSKLINWQRLEKHYAPYYSDKGRPANSIRLMVGLHLLRACLESRCGVAKIEGFENRSAAYVKVCEQHKRRKLLFAASQSRDSEQALRTRILLLP